MVTMTTITNTTTDYCHLSQLMTATTTHMDQMTTFDPYMNKREYFGQLNE